ncbi:NAD-dependent succinate-semialdehyde dehydrogenase [Paraburkholderia sp. J12]|uniref:NAD-dependent succinate-semialdehyde dehydrogenase n=1 Tax=Paraburkholderia sp. J12 TaxID=2805432 RepID=UPI002ABDEDED|nr:NAD-dependent succinate-semialdehyde dehydrogenase [Paraburkholderia sp. J12]
MNAPDKTTVSAYRPLSLIDGEWTSGGGPEEAVTNPVDRSVLGTFAHVTEDDLARAVAAASRAFVSWRSMPVRTRVQMLERAAQLLRERGEDIARTMTLEQGKPIGEARFEVERAANLVSWDAAEAQRAYGRVIPMEPGLQHTVVRQPIGPVASFTPWNFPLSSVIRKVAGPLAAGCTVVLKASEETPATACAAIRCFTDAGVPPGVINLVFGVPATISSYLIAHPAIRAVAFTGSVPVGRHIGALAAQHLKPAILELGGHAPVIICADADIEDACLKLVAAKYFNAGQACISPTRFLIEAPVYEAFKTRFVELASKVTLGNGLEPTTMMGPLANQRRIDAIVELVEDAKARGADVLCGGRAGGAQGTFFEPTVLENVPEDARIATSEPFGPVALLSRFERLDEAITRANSLPYGLAGYAFTRSSRAAARLTEEVECGMLSINHLWTGTAEAPFGGVKDSGYGREGGEESLDGYLVTRLVSHRAA